MRQLHKALRAAMDGSAGAVLVAGDAGVGKSRLLAEVNAVAQSEGAHVLRGRCLEVGETGLPYLPFVEVLGQLRGEHLNALRARPALARLLPDLLDPDLAESAYPAERRGEQDMGQLQMFDAVHSLLAELAAQRCVVLALEDLHWADGSTRYLLSFLLSRLRAERLLVVATYRTDDLHRRHPLRPLLAELVRMPAVERLELSAFDQTASRSFVRQLAEDGLPEEKVAEIAERSEGNAFFAEELLAACAECDDRVPIGLADVLLSRIERLGPDTQQVIKVVSVSGRRVRHSRLRAVVDLSDAELEIALREAITHHVLVFRDEQQKYVFRHSLLREAVYGDLLPGERVRLHGAYADHIATEDGVRGAAAELAHHSLESHNLALALSASVRAADEAVEVGAPAEALRHLEQALKLWRAVPEPESVAGVDELKLLNRSMHTAGLAGEPERALAYGRSAIKLAEKLDDPRRTAEVLRKYTQCLFEVEGKMDKAREVIERAWALAKDLPPSSTRAWVLAVRARAFIKCDAYTPDQVRALAEEAVRDGQAGDAPGAETDALISLAVLDENAGLVDQACQRLIAARDRAAQANVLSVEIRAWFNLGTNRYEQGLLRDATHVIDKGVRRATSTGLTWSNYGMELRVLQVVARYVGGDWDGSEAAAELTERSVPDAAAARVSAAGLYVRVGRGKFSSAAQQLASLHRDWIKDKDILVVALACGVELALWQQRPEQAVELFEKDAETVAKHRSIAFLRLGALGLCAYAEVAARARRQLDSAAEQEAVQRGKAVLEQVRTVVATAQPRTGELGPEGKAWLARAEAEASRLDGSEEPKLWRAVVAGFDYGHVYEQAIGRWRLAGTLLAGGDRESAAVELRQAHAAAERLGAAPLADAIAALAKRARIGLTDAVAAVRSTVDPLTPRERTVLGLVAKGQTNRQVGEQLFISEKTVSVHLTRIMAKLGASSRTEAVTLAHDRALL